MSRRTFLAIAGVAVPFVVGFAGHYSKDAILEQALLFGQTNNSAWALTFFVLALVASYALVFFVLRGVYRRSKRPTFRWLVVAYIALTGGLVAFGAVVGPCRGIAAPLGVVGRHLDRAVLHGIRQRRGQCLLSRQVQGKGGKAVVHQLRGARTGAANGARRGTAGAPTRPASGRGTCAPAARRASRRCSLLLGSGSPVRCEGR